MYYLSRLLKYYIQYQILNILIQFLDSQSLSQSVSPTFAITPRHLFASIDLTSFFLRTVLCTVVLCFFYVLSCVLHFLRLPRSPYETLYSVHTMYTTMYYIGGCFLLV